MKLVHFIEQIFHKNIFLASISKETLTKEAFYNRVSRKFHTLFHNNNNENEFLNTSINYSYTCSDTTFDLTAKWNNGKLVWNSEYLNNRFDEWRGFFTNGNTPDAVQNVRTQIHDRLRHDFNNTFPIGTLFIPAARAIAAIVNTLNTEDPYINDFVNNDKPFVLSFDEISDERVNKILRLNDITSKNNDSNEKILEALSLDGKKITPLEFSSGQQELIYLLLLIRNLYQTTFYYGQTTSIFVEEPCAHLFPQEQKESMEYIARVFRELQEIDYRARFFISTHSPYVLNVTNNMLKKGHLIEKADNCPDEAKKQLMREEIKKLGFPHLSVNEVSAHFIKKEVGSMINESENGAYLYEEVIEAITRQINYDHKQVRDILRQFGE
jgi:hypothetical protein